MTRPEDSQRIANLVFYSVVLLIAYLGYQIVQPFLIEIAWALVLAICLAPAQTRLSRRIGCAAGGRPADACSCCCCSSFPRSPP